MIVITALQLKNCFEPGVLNGALVSALYTDLFIIFQPNFSPFIHLNAEGNISLLKKKMCDNSLLFYQTLKHLKHNLS